MIAMSNDTHFLLFWLTFTAMGLGAVAAGLVWAVRSGQFADQDRARHLPLMSNVPEEGKEDLPQSAPADAAARSQEDEDHAAS